MKKKTSEEFIQEASENIIKDRERLVGLFDDYVKFSKEQMEDMGPVSVGDQLIKLADSLTKQTAQVIELAKIKQKSEEKKQEDDKWNEDDSDDFYSVVTEMDNKELKAKKN